MSPDTPNRTSSLINNSGTSQTGLAWTKLDINNEASGRLLGKTCYENANKMNCVYFQNYFGGL